MQKIFTEIGVLIALTTIMTACTLSMQNISTHGTANDLVDESQAATAHIKPDIKVSSI